MNTSVRNLLVLGCVAVALVGVYNVVFPPLTRAEAAATAARCVGWPTKVATGIEANFQDATTLNDPVLLAFGHAKMVRVSDMGTCGAVTDSQLMSAEPLYHLPPMSRVPDAKQDYILYLLDEGHGGWVFGAVRAGTAVVHPDGEEHTPPDSI